MRRKYSSRGAAEVRPPRSNALHVSDRHLGQGHRAVFQAGFFGDQFSSSRARRLRRRLPAPLMRGLSWPFPPGITSSGEPEMAKGVQERTFDMLRSLTGAAISIRQASTLDEATLTRMWALYAPHHQMDRREFDEKLSTLDEIALFTARNDRSLIGFCGLRRRLVQLRNGRRAATFYLGLTYVRTEWRSTGLIQQMVLRRVLAPLITPRLAVYFWADCLTFRPYLAMARNLHEYYPARTGPTTEEAAEVIDILGATYYGDSFDADRGIVRKSVRRIKSHEACVSATDLQDPDIRFFAERNADHDRGDGLIAVFPMGVRNLVHLLVRQIGKGRLEIRLRHPSRAGATARAA